MPIERELCFVWGPPLSGQRRWMLRAALGLEPSVEVRLVLTEEDEGLESVLGRVAQEIEGLSGETSARVYCELPWPLLLQDFEIEDWLQGQAAFTAPVPDWGVGFVGLLPADLHRLPKVERTLIEDFGRASISEILLVKRVGDEQVPLWVEEGLPDFGKKMKVFEEDLWSKPMENLDTPPPSFEEVPDLEILQLPVLEKPSEMEALLREILNGSLGLVWAAEWTLVSAEACCQGWTLTQGGLFAWEEQVRGRLNSAPLAKSVLRIRGQHLDQTALVKGLRERGLWVEA